MVLGPGDGIGREGLGASVVDVDDEVGVALSDVVIEGVFRIDFSLFVLLESVV